MGVGLWVELCPLHPQINTEVLTPSTSECDLVWKQGRCRYNQLNGGYQGLPRRLSSEESACNAGAAELTPGSGRPPGARSSVLAWRVPWTEEPGGLQPIALQRVRHDEVTWQAPHT